MSTGELEILEAAFDKAAGLDGEARDRFLAEFAEMHPDLASRLVSLLSADEKSGDFGKPVAMSLRRMASKQRERLRGQMLGAWTLGEVIGSGGMGTVYLAERSDGAYTQTAALKVVSAYRPGGLAEARFKSERQILASLDHRGIARLLDGGADADGLPFLVMEYVKGDRLDRYCDKRGLGITDRLKLFVMVCDAVDYAHRQLVIHRDLKPGNILVTDDGQPKILDFGVAKLLQPQSIASERDLTREDQRFLTPEYASPEQVRGERATVATDVYALGVLLFGLLTGKSPYGEASQGSQYELERAILDSDPVMPSTSVARSSDPAKADGQSFEAGENPVPPMPAEQLRRRLSGDLDNILLKCLQKEPHLRYASAAALAEDIENHLAGYPVSARGDIWVYRAQKFLRRNAARLALAATVVVAIVGLSGFYANRLAQERDRAEIQAAKATQIAEFMTEVFRSPDPNVAQGSTVTAIELLDQALERIDALDDQPLMQAELLGILGNTYRARGEEQKGRSLIERAIAIHRRASTGSDADRLVLAGLIGDLAEAHRLSENPAKSLELQRQALAMREELLPRDDPAIASTLTRLGVTSFDLRDRDGGLAYLERAMALHRSAGRENTPEAIDTLGNIGITLDSLGRYEAAENVLRETTRRSDEIEGPLAPNSIIRLGNLGLLLTRTSRFSDAEKIQREAVRRSRIVFPEGQPQTGFAVSNLAVTLHGLGRMAEARDTYLEAARLSRLASGEESLDYAARRRSLANLEIELRNFAMADRRFKQALEIVRRVGGPKHHYRAQILALYARSQRLQGKPAQAEALLRTALKDGEGLNSARTLAAQRELAIALSEQGKVTDAKTILEQGVSEIMEEEGANSPRLIAYEHALATNALRADQAKQALTHAERAYRRARELYPEKAWQTAEIGADYARILEANGRTRPARQIGRSSMQILAGTFGEQDSRVAALRRAGF